jgi:hypothetical protein
MCDRETSWESCRTCNAELRKLKTSVTKCAKVENTSTPPGYCPGGWVEKKKLIPGKIMCRICLNKPIKPTPL